MDELVDALRTDLARGGDFPGRLALALAEVAQEAGGAGALIEGRPGSWEAELVYRLAFGAGAGE